jgi:hypothetical protein
LGPKKNNTDLIFPMQKGKKPSHFIAGRSSKRKKNEQTTPSPRDKIGSATPCYIADPKYLLGTILRRPTLVVATSRKKWVQITGVGDSIPYFFISLGFWIRLRQGTFSCMPLSILVRAVS